MRVDELEQVIRVVKALVSHSTKRKFSQEADPNHVVQYFFEKQGENTVIQILEGIMNGNIKMKDYDNED